MTPLPTTMTSLLRIGTLAALTLSPVALFAQGVLAPAGSPAPSMKTLTQIEPRTPVSSLSGDATSVYVIDQPGSYYLTGHIDGVAGKNGIKINARNVTLDLSGFTLRGVDGSLDAIRLTSSSGAVVIQNGIIQSWGGSGINGPACYGSQVRNLTINAMQGGAGVVLGYQSLADNVSTESTKVAGILLGANSAATHCVVGSVGPLDTPYDDYVSGITADTVTACTVSNLIGLPTSDGVYAISAKTVENCTVRSVSANGASNGSGISAHVVRGSQVELVNGAADQTSGIVGVTVHDSFVVDVSGPNSAGIRAFGYGLHAHHNRLVRCGIVTGPGARVVENSITLNPGSGTGILAESSSSVIDGNHVVGGNTGIWVTTANNRVVRNFVSASTTKYSIAAGNQAPAAIVTADDITTASPWANFSQ